MWQLRRWARCAGSELVRVDDLSVGAFSEDPPWLVRPHELTWRSGLTAIRSVARRQVPALTAPRGNKPPLGGLRGAT